MVGREFCEGRFYAWYDPRVSFTRGRHGDDGLRIGREGLKPIFDFVDQAVEADKPFFLWYVPFMPHSPHNPPEALFRKYKAKGIEWTMSLDITPWWSGLMKRVVSC